METYSTASLGEIAYLLESGLCIKSIVKAGEQTTFYFDNTGGLAKLYASEYSNGAKVVAVRFFETLKRVKRIAVRGELT